MRDVQVREPVISDGHISAVLDVGFYRFVERIALTAEIYFAEVA